MEAAQVVVNIVLFGGLLLLAAGYFWKDRNRHLLRMTGSLLLAAFFAYEVARIIEAGKDAWNVSFTAIAAPVFLYVAFNEGLSYRWDEENESLKWIAGTAFVAGLIYYTFDRVELLTAGIVWVTAVESVWFGQMFGYGSDFVVGKINWDNVPLSVSIDGAPVNIILACTGIEAIVIFVGAIFATQMRADPWAVLRDPDRPKYRWLRSMSPRERALRALLLSVSVIWVGNMLRNVLIIYLVDTTDWTFEFIHGTLGKSMSFVILLVIAFIVFGLMPEMLDNIAGIVDLWNRKSPEERRKEAMEREQAEAEKAKGEQDEGDGGEEDEGEDETEEGAEEEGDTEGDDPDDEVAIILEELS